MKFQSDLASRLAKLKLVQDIGQLGRDRLSDLGEFGSNPGALKARIYVPADLPDAAPLVVVLHGCTQTAGGYDHGSGWSSLADRYGFALLYPEQQRNNNANGCFNWFDPNDTRRGAGEALSIRQMIERMVTRHDLDRDRVFVTGLSAGGAMASVMLATYPDVFAGGAIIAGLPYGCAASIPEALGRMRDAGRATDQELGALVRGASSHGGPWPRVSIWHGSADHTVDSSNADLVLAQWRNVHGLDRAATRTESVDGHPRRIWCDRHGQDVIEEYRIDGMGHGTPLATGGLEGCGASGAFMLEVAISSTVHSARFWGLIGEPVSIAEPRAAIRPLPAVRKPEQAGPFEAASARAKPETGAGFAPQHRIAGGGPGKIIEDALRAAGLMR